MDHQRQQQRKRQDPSRAHPEHREQRGEIHGAGRDKAEPVDRDDVEHVDAEGQRECEQVPVRARPRLERDPLRALVTMGARGEALYDQKNRAHRKADRNDPGEQRRAILLPGNLGEALDMHQ